MVGATVCISFVSMSVWAHHMFTIGMNSYANSFFTLTTMAMGVPTGIKIFNWIGTMWGGKIHSRRRCCSSIAFLFQFLIAGLTGIMMAARHSIGTQPLLFCRGALSLCDRGRNSVRTLRRVLLLVSQNDWPNAERTTRQMAFLAVLIGFHLTFDVMHIPGVMGMPRRIYTYEPGRGWDTLNFIITIGAFIQALAILVFLANLVISYFKGAKR